MNNYVDFLKDMIRIEGNEKEGEYRGYKYIILRMNRYIPNRINLNGYVALPENHLFKNEYSSSWCGHSGCYEHTAERVIKVHGGLTFPGNIKFSDGEHFCLGFDTAHAGDRRFLADLWGGKYRDMEYVENECKRMIDQLILIQVHQEVQ